MSTERILRTILLGSALLPLIGCVVPYPAKRVTETFAGIPVQAQLLQPGVSRDDVRRALRTGVIAEGPNLMWVRVRSSRSGMIVGFGGVGPGGGAWVTDNDRVWHTRNLFLEFDGNNDLTSYVQVDDSKLITTLTAYLASNEFTLQPSSSSVVPFLKTRRLRKDLCELSLGSAEATLQCSDEALRISPESLLRVDHRRRCVVTGEDETMCEAITFRTQGRERTIVVRMHGADLLTLLAYIQKHSTNRR